ncbi:MAG: replicative DNA helicase [Oscillospiraceae bacterium]|jgi:replicative DNA helicase|nr:replicative DNA helicase [Oscillospiraceae bacterium]
MNMPYSLEAEQAVLGSILIDPPCINQIQSTGSGFKTEYFYLPQHRAIYSVMLSIEGMGGKIDPLLVLEKLKEEKIYDDAAGKTYLFQLAQSVPSTANVEAYAKIVREKFYIRTLLNVSKEIIDSASGNDESADTLLDIAEQKIYDIRQGRNTSGAARIGDILTDSVYDRLTKLNSPEREKYLGFSTGFSDIDRVISGLNKSDLIIVGARPAMGKTSFALNIARNVTVQAKRKVLFFSLEMTKEQIAQRVLATEARVLGTKMRTGLLNEGEWTRISAATSALYDCPLYFDDTSNITVQEMKARVRRLKDVDCVIIDYLQLMKSGGRTENRVQEVSEITRNLKLMAKDLNIPVIVLAQLARGTEGRGKNHRPQLSDLRESGSIEQDADIVMMLYRDDYYNHDEDINDEDEVNKVEVLVQKNRHGPTENIELGWDPDFTLFRALERNRDGF